MVNNEQTYLLQLKNWSEETRKLLQEEGLTVNEMEQWEKWNDAIDKYLSTNVDVHQLDQLRDEAEKMIHKLYEKKLERKERAIYGQHELPPLPYSYDALEPYISEEIMRLHHLVHQQAYVDGLNKAEHMIYQTELDPSSLRHWLREQSFNGSGNILHSIFWTNMTPNSSKMPVKRIQQQIINDFGSFEAFKNLFTNVASSVQGPGWAALLYDPINRRLVVESIEEHQVNHLVNMIPILVLDVWEHAYYLQYLTEKADYVKSWWNIVNWEDVNDRFIQAENI